MALAYRQNRDMEQAVDCMKRALAISPGYDPIVAGLGGLLVEAGQLDEAEVFYRDRLESHPEDVRVYIGLGFIATKADRWDEALDWYLGGLRLDPGSSDILSGLYQSYLRLGRLADAENVLERWLQFHPNDESARRILQDLRSQLKDRNRGEKAGATSFDAR